MTIKLSSPEVDFSTVEKDHSTTNMELRKFPDREGDFEDLNSSDPETPERSHLTRKHSLSDTSDVSTCSDGSEERRTSPVIKINNKTVVLLSEEEVAEKIIAQVESMFSDKNLARDGFLQKHVVRRPDGFVSLKLVAGLRKVKQISHGDFPAVLNSLKKSSVLEISSDGTKIRRVTPFVLNAQSNNNENDNKEVESNPEITVEQFQLVNRRKQNAKINRKNKGQSQRKVSNGSSIGSNDDWSRNGSFSLNNNEKLHPADLFLNATRSSFSGSSDDSHATTTRSRGGSLPIVNGRRPSSANPSPSSSPPKLGFLRPKSNSHGEVTTNMDGTSTTMSPWLLRRKEASRNSEGSICLSGVLRQPRGPDGTKGFPVGYRNLILREKSTLLNSHTTISV